MSSNAQKMREKLTKTVKSPDGNEYLIRRSNASDYLQCDFIPEPDPTLKLSAVQERSWVADRLHESRDLQAKVMRAIVAKCTLDPKIVNGDIRKIADDEIHAEMLGTDLDWLFTEIDKFTRGRKSNPSTGSAS